MDLGAVGPAHQHAAVEGEQRGGVRRRAGGVLGRAGGARRRGRSRLRVDVAHGGHPAQHAAGEAHVGVLRGDAHAHRTPATEAVERVAVVALDVRRHGARRALRDASGRVVVGPEAHALDHDPPERVADAHREPGAQRARRGLYEARGARRRCVAQQGQARVDPLVAHLAGGVFALEARVLDEALARVHEEGPPVGAVAAGLDRDLVLTGGQRSPPTRPCRRVCRRWRSRRRPCACRSARCPVCATRSRTISTRPRRSTSTDLGAATPPSPFASTVCSARLDVALPGRRADVGAVDEDLHLRPRGRVHDEVAGGDLGLERAVHRGHVAAAELHVLLERLEAGLRHRHDVRAQVDAQGGGQRRGPGVVTVHRDRRARIRHADLHRAREHRQLVDRALDRALVGDAHRGAVLGQEQLVRVVRGGEVLQIAMALRDVALDARARRQVVGVRKAARASR